MSDINHIAVILPCLDEGPNLNLLLPQLVGRYRTIVVDNGSKDDSIAIATKAGSEVISCGAKGYGNAVLAGMAYIANQPDNLPQVIVVCDADGTSPASAIPSIIQPILSGSKDFVIGQRKFKQKGAMPSHANFGNWLTVTLMQWCTGFRYHEMGPLRAIRYRSLLDLNMIDRTWGWNVEMQMKAIWQQLRIEEVPITYLRRAYGKSKISGSLWGSIKAGTKIISRVGYFYGEYLLKRMTLAPSQTSECNSNQK
ncbi:MAG: glycosyltransferase family 2 protein [Pseudobacteriovorax sp.]|nr:glycosyltransferase family 2 protein [Pseudobacteriovorax sp.]